MKKLIFILFFSFWANIYSQEQTINPELFAFPVSPEAARLGTYGSVPVNLFYGQLDKSIELFNGKVEDFSLPINLNYSYAGFRVEETPSIVGLGWQLNLGGVVTREVRGYPDEHPNFGYYAANRQIIETYFNEGTMTDENALQITNKKFDTEVDRYIVSVNGINFSFKIGLDGNPVFLSKHNYKIEIVRNPNNNLDVTSFILTDSNSNRYFFEYEETNEPAGGASDAFIYDDNFPRYTSSWQLSKIIVNNNSVINFNYQDDDFYSYNYFAVGVYRGRFGEGQQTTYDQGSTRELIKRKILTSITSTKFNLYFSIINSNGQKVYDKLTIKDFNNNIVDYYDFIYSGNRNTLDRINKKNHFFYEFTYSGDIANCQGFMNSIYEYPWNQDEWGFANGIFNNFAISMVDSQYSADKTPSFFHTVLGSLKTIKYPTGGQTEFFYEQNTISSTYAQDEEPNVRISLKFKSDNISTAPEIKEQVFTKTFATDVIAELSHTIESTNQGFIEMSIVGSTASCNSVAYGTGEQYYNDIPYQRATLANPSPLICPRLYAAFDDGCTSSYCSSSGNSSGKFIIKAGTYEFRFKTIQNRFKDVKASVTLDFYDADVAEFTNKKTNKKMGGIRVSKTVDSPVTGNEIVNHYNYNNADGSSVGNTFGTLINVIPYRERFGYIIPSGSGSAQIVFNEFNVLEYNAKSYNAMLKRGTPVVYSGVKEYIAVEEVFTSARLLCSSCGGNFGGNYDASSTYSYLGGEYGTTKTKYPEGYMTTGFDTPQKIPSFEYPFPPNGEDLSIGMMNKKEVFSKTDSNYNHKLLVEEKSIYSYSTNVNSPAFINAFANANYPKSLKIGYKIKRRGVIGLHSDFNLNDYYVLNVYKEVDSESFKTNINTKEYLNSTPVERNVAIEYDLFNQQHKITTNDSNSDIKTNEIFYPYDFTDAVSQNMVAKNNIAPTVKVVNKKNGQIMESAQFNFNQISTNLFKPVSYSKSKGSNSIEDRIKYSYDNQNGNLISFAKLGATTGSSSGNLNTVIIWGYNKSQPIAKIENATYGEVQSQVANLQQLSNNGTEADLIAALNLLRISLPNAMVTTYTYIPLIGMSTMTDTKGSTLYYKYDDRNRLQEVKDADGNILTENEYHYKN